jgi:hypothetical protein
MLHNVYVNIEENNTKNIVNFDFFILRTVLNDNYSKGTVKTIENCKKGRSKP